MLIREIDKNLFDEISKNNMFSSFYETSYYGEVMRKYDYKVKYYACYDNDLIIGSFLMLSKSISINIKYGYSPRGFLVDYFNKYTFEEFTKAVKKFFSKKGYAFIKINPIIILNQVNMDGSKVTNSLSSTLISTMEENNYKKLKDNLYFESMLPKYNAIISLKDFNKSNLDSKLIHKLDKVNNKGLNFIKGDFYNLNSLYELTYRKDGKSSDFYKTLYKMFDQDKKVDLFLVEVNYHEYLLNLQGEHNTEETINEKVNRLFQLDPTNKNIYNEKMNSDRKLNEINEEIHDVNTKISEGIYKEVVAGALVIKHNNIASIFTSGFNKKYNKLLPNHFLHYNLINHYKENNYSYLDLNGITGDFTKDNPYKGLNEFKLSFNPKVYEYIGEFDLIINQTKYSLLWSTKALHKEFEKKM